MGGEDLLSSSLSGGNRGLLFGEEHCVNECGSQRSAVRERVNVVLSARGKSWKG